MIKRIIVLGLIALMLSGLNYTVEFEYDVYLPSIQDSPISTPSPITIHTPVFAPIATPYYFYLPIAQKNF